MIELWGPNGTGVATTNSAAADEVYDWRHLFEPFVEGIRKLRDHIAAHDFYVENEKDIDDMDHFLQMWEQWDDLAPNGRGLDEYLADETRRWNELMDYLRDHMRNWWC